MCHILFDQLHIYDMFYFESELLALYIVVCSITDLSYHIYQVRTCLVILYSSTSYFLI